MKLFKQLLVPVLVIACFSVAAQPTINTNKKDGCYTFTIQKQVGCTSVKNQFKSGTCWIFSSHSFLESEILRNSKKSVDLSEMFIDYYTYIDKAKHFLRYQGSTGFGEGGEPWDVINVIREYGIAPKEAFPGIPGGKDKPIHGEMSNVLKAMLDAMVKVPDGKLNPNWEAVFTGALNGYLGKPPEKFTVDGKEYTPKTYAKALGIDPDDYVTISSFTHHPFYTQFIMEVSDNWANNYVYNIPLDEFKKVAENAIANDYSIEWASDVSEKGFSFKNGIAIVPEKDYDDMTQTEKDSMLNQPGKEKNITQQLRQEAFDNLSTTDDHGMQIMGSAKDQNGADYFLVKNSWGTERNDLNGYFYCSMPYFLYKTTSMMVNKHAIPKDIAKKMGIKL